MSETVFDPGLQPERTLLAWRRTCLAFVVASAVALRFTVGSFGVVAVIISLVTAGLSAAAYFLMAHGYRRVHRALTAEDQPPSPGIPIAFACAATLLLGATCAAFLVVSAF